MLLVIGRSIFAMDQLLTIDQAVLVFVPIRSRLSHNIFNRCDYLVTVREHNIPKMNSIWANFIRKDGIIITKNHDYKRDGL